MKNKFLTIIFLSITHFCYSQIGINLPSPQTFTVIPQRIINGTTVPAKTATADSIYVLEIINTGSIVYSNMILFIGNTPTQAPFNTIGLILWEGVDYSNNTNYTNETVKARIKTLLNIQ